LLAFMEGRPTAGLSLNGVALQRIAAGDLPARFGYVSVPSAPAT
jgi:hypothetical protein